MGRLLQFASLVLCSFVGHAQCDSTRITKLVEGNCTYIVLSPELFTSYWSAHRQLEKVTPALLDARAKLDSMRATTAKVDNATIAQIASLEKQKSLWKDSAEYCHKERTKQDLKLKRLNKTWGVVTAVAVLLTLILCN